jgi:hypothetical protein
MSIDILWNTDEPISKLEALETVEVPAWISEDISPYDVAAIVQGGCASGAYMPAVTYWQALATMNEHGDTVLQYIEDQLGEIPQPAEVQSWAGLACHYVSLAVEIWASSVAEPITEALQQAGESEAE